MGQPPPVVFPLRLPTPGEFFPATAELVARDRGICNKDVKVRNFIVRRDSETGAFKPVMIDFGLCELRSQAKDEREFNVSKRIKMKKAPLDR